MQEIILRREAKSKGLDRFYTGKPCKRGELSERRTHDGKCLCDPCWEFRRQLKRNHYQENKEIVLKRNREWQEKNADRVNEYAKEYREENKASISEQKKAWYQDNRDKVLERVKSRYHQNPDEKIERQKAYYQENRERIKAYKKRWHRDNRHIHREQYHRRKHDPDFQAVLSMRRVLSNFLRDSGGQKTDRTHSMLGYSYDEFKAHIERQFKRGMGWHNRHLWHIDHIVPVVAHVRDGETDPSVVNALTNLRPVWSAENLSKGETRTHLL